MKVCPHEFDENFIKMHLKRENELLEKYLKFKRSEICNNQNVGVCPIENCDSYSKKLEKKYL